MSTNPDKYSLLVVDDNATSVVLMREILVTHGYQVMTATDGDQAIVQSETNRPDLIIMDVMMPGMDGFETCRRLKANAQTANIPIIFLTAQTETDKLVQGLKIGASDYIVKPFTSAEILARINTQLRVVALTRELQTARDFQEQEVMRRTKELEAANQALKISHNLLQSVLDAVPELLFVVDRDFTIVFSNNQKNKMVPEPGDPDACPTCFSRFKQRKSPCKKCLVQEVFAFGQSVEREVVSDADGRIFEIRAFPIYDESGGVSLAVEYLRDITSIKQAERENEQRRQFLEAVLEYAPDAIVTLDEKHHVIDWNPGAVRMFGYQPEEAIGRHLDSLVSHGLHGEEKAEKTNQVMSGKVVEPFETIRQRRDGSDFNVIAAGSPIMLEDRMVGAVAVYSDISAMKVAEEELRRSHELFLTVLESIDATIYVADLTSHEILFMNKQMQEKFGGDLTGGMCWRDFRDQDGPCSSCFEALDSLGNPGESRVFEDYNPKTGCWSRTHQRIIKWVDQRPVCLQMASDITDHKRIEGERQEYERRIQQLQKMEAIGTLAGGIAHDFNNILSAVFGYTELAFIQVGNSPVLQRNLGGILQAAKRAKDLVQQILLFSRQGEQELKPLQLKPLVKEALKMLRSSVPTTIRIQTQIDGEFENVLANPTQIHQIVMNLCANAAQAMEDDGGVLTVGLSQVELLEEDVRRHPGRKSGTYLKLRTEDTGRGIPADMIDKIYNPYFTTKAKGQGTGLGLSVVHGIVQSYSGIIEVHSELGRGTAFDIFLPAIPLPASSEELPIISLPGGKEHILLVDDEEIIIEVLGSMLEVLGYQVTTRQSSVDALQLFQATPDRFDLLITDMTMPEMTGDRLAAEIRNVRLDIPIIICSGYNRRLNDSRPETLAVQAILMKPVEHADLARMVRQVLDDRRRMEEPT